MNLRNFDMNVTRRSSRKARKRRGAHTVEFALVFPIVLTFFLGLIFLSRALLLKDTAQHAAFEGARAGIILNASERDSQQAVADFTRRMGLKDVRTTIKPRVITNEDEVITVNVSIPMASNAWVTTGFMPTNLDIESEVTLTRRKE